MGGFCLPVTATFALASCHGLQLGTSAPACRGDDRGIKHRAQTGRAAAEAGTPDLGAETWGCTRAQARSSCSPHLFGGWLPRPRALPGPSLGQLGSARLLRAWHESGTVGTGGCRMQVEELCHRSPGLGSSGRVPGGRGSNGYLSCLGQGGAQGTEVRPQPPLQTLPAARTRPGRAPQKWHESPVCDMAPGRTPPLSPSQQGMLHGARPGPAYTSGQRLARGEPPALKGWNKGPPRHNQPPNLAAGSRMPQVTPRSEGGLGQVPCTHAGAQLLAQALPNGVFLPRL